MPVDIDWKLVVRDGDAKWTEVTKKVINAIVDYASKSNKFRTVRIGSHEEIDALPGFYILFPGLDDQDRIAYERNENTFMFECLYACTGKDYRDALQQLLEAHGEFLKKAEEDPDMLGGAGGVPEIGVAQVRNMEVLGLSLAVRTGQSKEYLYGRTTVQVFAIIKPRG